MKVYIFVQNVELPSWSHGDTSTLFQVVRGLHQCTATLNIIVSLLVWFIQVLSIRTYMKSLTYKRAPLGMEELLDHAWSGRLTAASVTYVKMEVTPLLGSRWLHSERSAGCAVQWMETTMRLGPSRRL